MPLYFAAVRPVVERDILAKIPARPRDILREKGTPAAELGLLDASATDDQILDAMTAHPVLVNRPIVVTPKGAVLARPPERVLDVLDGDQPEFSGADGA